MAIKNKRGISEIITTVLMVLLVIAAIGIIWFVIQNFLSSNVSTIDPSTECLKTSLAITSVAINDANSLNVSVARSGESLSNFSSMKFYVDGSLQSNVTLANGASPIQWTQTGETRIYRITMATAGLSGKEAKVAGVIQTVTCQNTATKTIA